MNEMAAWPPPHDPIPVDDVTGIPRWFEYHIQNPGRLNGRFTYAEAEPLFDRPDTDRAYRESLDVGRAVKFGLAFSLPFLVIGVVMLVVML